MKKYISTLALAALTCHFAQAQYANQDLSNLSATTAVNQTLLPGTSGILSLGSTAKPWKNLSLKGDIYIGGYATMRVTANKGTFLGRNAGPGSTSPGLFNTALGFTALTSTTAGGYNTALGGQALYGNTTGPENTATGYNALYSNTTGRGNTAHGFQALTSNTTGAYNLANGYQAMASIRLGNYNVANGYQALFNNFSGDYNIANGYQALYNNGDGGSYAGGNGNIATGYQALYYNFGGNYNVANGYQALLNNGGGVPASGGNYNIATGYQALSGNSTGNYNTAIGSGALVASSSGNNNVAVGDDAMSENNTGSRNTALGSNALRANDTGDENTGIGNYALANEFSGDANTAVGSYAYTNGYYTANTAIGYAALSSQFAGSYNTSIGISAGTATASAGYPQVDNCTFLGSQSTIEAQELYNTTTVGYQARGLASNQVMVGNSSVTSIGGYANWTNFSDGRYKKNIKENVPGLAFIKLLHAVTYNLDVPVAEKTSTNGLTANGKGPKVDLKKEEAKSQSLAEKAVAEKNKIVYTGFVAQDVEAAAKKLNYDFSGVKKPANDKDYYGLRYAEFVVPLVKAVQELADKNDALSEQNNSLQAQNTSLQAQNAQMESRLTAIEQLLSKTNGGISLNSNSLGQNIPNPSKGSTIIPFNLLPENNNASIVITDAGSGKILKTVTVNPSQKSISVEVSNLASGTYIYSLIANGKTVDSKKMVIAK